MHIDVVNFSSYNKILNSYIFSQIILIEIDIEHDTFKDNTFFK